MSIEKRPEPAGVFGALVVEQDGTLHGAYETRAGKKRTVLFYPDRLTEPGIFLSFHSDRVRPAEWGNIMEAFFLAWRIAGIKEVPNFLTDFQ